MTVFLNFNFLFFIIGFPYFIFFIHISFSFFSLFFSPSHTYPYFFFFVSFFPLFPYHFLHTHALTFFLFFLLSSFSLLLHSLECSTWSWALSSSFFFYFLSSFLPFLLPVSLQVSFPLSHQNTQIFLVFCWSKLYLQNVFLRLD